MEDRYNDYNGYRPGGPPSYADSLPPNNSYSGSVLSNPRIPPSYSDSVPRSFDKENGSYSDMNRQPRDRPYNPQDYDRPDSRDRYSNRDPRYDDRDPGYDDRSYPRYDDRRAPPDDRRYDDRGPRYDDRDPRYEPYDDPRYDRRYDDRRYDDRRTPPEDMRYDDRSDSYEKRPYRDDPPYDDRSYRSDPSERFDDRPRNGADYNHQYSDDRDSRLHYNNGGSDARRADPEDVRLRENEAKYNTRTENVELSYQPQQSDKTKKKPILKEMKPKMIKDKWQNKPMEEKKKYGILICILILIIVLIIVVPCAIYVRLWHKLTWSDIIKLQVKPRDIKWGQQGRFVYYKDFSNNLIRVDLTGESEQRQEIILEFEQWNKVGYDDFDVTGPGSMLILAKNSDRACERHLCYVNLYKYKIGDPLNEPQMFQTDVVSWEILSHETDDKIVFVNRDADTGAFNIHLDELGPDFKTLKDIGTVTSDKEFLRGVLCYMYAEEFFGKSSKGFWISTNGDYIVFMETDISAVQTVAVQEDGEEKRYSYPMPGGTNPIVNLKLYNVYEDELVDHEALNLAGKQDKHYITSVSFPNSKKLLIEFMNRQQTRAVTEECTLSMSPQCEDLPILRRDSYQGWLPRYKAVAFPVTPEASTQQYYVLRPRVDQQFNFTHLHKYETTNDPLKKIAITSGEFAVTDLIGNDYTRRHLLYVRTEAIDLDVERTSVTRKRMLYLYNATDDTHTCISCMEPEDRCNVATASIDSTRQGYMLECLGPMMPYKRIKWFANNTWNLYGDENQNMQYENPSLQAQLLQKRWPRHEYTQTELDKNSKMYVAVKKIFPLYYVPYANILKYPLVIWVNPYPDGNMATETYNLGLAQWMATNHDCVVMYMDVKGTPGRGLAFHHHPYKNFQEIVAKSTQAIRDIKMYWHVNDNKVAIMGEGIGGWLALKMAEAEPDWFKAVIAVNPILDFQKYLSAYSERYLDLPATTLEKYQAAAITADTLGSANNEVRYRSAVYYDPGSYIVPNTWSSIETARATTFNNVALYNITQVVEALPESERSGDLWTNLGTNITEFLQQSPHDIF